MFFHLRYAVSLLMPEMAAVPWVITTQELGAFVDLILCWTVLQFQTRPTVAEIAGCLTQPPLSPLSSIIEPLYYWTAKTNSHLP